MRSRWCLGGASDALSVSDTPRTAILRVDLERVNVDHRDRLRRRRRRPLARLPLGVELEVFVRCEDAKRFVEEVRGDAPVLASRVRIEERCSRPPSRPRRAVHRSFGPQTEDSTLMTLCATVWRADIGGGVGNVRDRFKVC